MHSTDRVSPIKSEVAVPPRPWRGDPSQPSADTRTATARAGSLAGVITAALAALLLGADVRVGASFVTGGAPDLILGPGLQLGGGVEGAVFVLPNLRLELDGAAAWLHKPGLPDYAIAHCRF